MSFHAIATNSSWTVSFLGASLGKSVSHVRKESAKKISNVAPPKLAVLAMVASANISAPAAREREGYFKCSPEATAFCALRLS